MNNFPAMTELQRQELIERCEEFIKQCEYATHAEAMTEADELDLLITQIALRALTAEPVAVLYSSGEVLTKEECADQRVFEICCRVETPLFDAPPAPVLKPIELASDMKSNPRAHETMQAYRDGWNDRGKADVDMLLSAGYEVKS